MDLRRLLAPRGARRRFTAAAVISAIALGAGAIVAAGHGRANKRHSPLAGQSWSQARRNPLLYVSRKTFAAQMRWLDRHGFRAVTLDQVEDAWSGRGLLPRRPIVVSFDDGYYSQYHTAMPILRRHHWAGVLSLCLGNMKQAGGPITAAQVQRMVNAGWELASHTISHRDLRFMKGKRLRHEVRDSRRIIRYVFRVPVHNFTYPAGLYDEATIRALKRAGYRGALTVAPGLAGRHHPFELKRIRIIQSMGVTGFAGELKSLGV